MTRINPEYCNTYLKENHPALAEKFSVVGYEDRKATVSSKYGDLVVYWDHLKRGYTPTIRAAVNKQEFYINQCKETHKDLFSYESLVYKGENIKVTVTCPRHGDFEVVACAHKSGNGCLQCKNEDHPGKYNTTTAERNKTEWLKKEAVLYVLELKGEEERFFKYGITVDLNNRVDHIKRSSKGKYEVKVKDIIQGSLYELILAEDSLHKDNSECFRRYMPRTKFAGYTECIK